MIKYIQILLAPLFLSFIITAWTQDINYSRNLAWKGIISETNSQGNTNRFLYFGGASVDLETNLPAFDYKSEGNFRYTYSFDSLLFAPCSQEENQFIQHTGFNQEDISIVTSLVYDRKIPFEVARFIPIRYNKLAGTYEKLIYFQLNASILSATSILAANTVHNYADHSVLKEGNWYKFKTEQSGLYEITYNDLLNAGINPDAINPAHIKLFGNGGGMLPEANSISRKDDLKEIPIIVEGQEDGTFDQNDKIIFYGQSPHIWNEVLGVFLRDIHLYDNSNYYFLTLADEPGLRVETEIAPGNPNHFIHHYNDYQLHEEELISLILSGKTWYGEEFGQINQRMFSFSFPDIDTSENVIIKIGFANRTYLNDYMIVKVNNELFDTITMTSVDPGQTTYARKKKKTFTYTASGPDINVELEYLPNASSSRAWLDYINVNVSSHLNFHGGQMAFRDLSSILEGARTEFYVANTTESTKIIDVSDNNNIRFLETTFTEGLTSFVVSTDSLREFIAFDGTSFLTPDFLEEVPNQDIHGQGPVDYVIVSHPLFTEQALRLKILHDTLDGFQTLLVEPEQIYNEFSSGKQDPSAIRDMMKMFYDKYPDNIPRYLLLFGDGSVDPKDRVEHNTNYIVTFQTEESLIASQSYVVDDYFGLLDDNEGNDSHGYLDIGIGRIPTQTAEEAKVAVDKIYSYLSKKEPQFGAWRNQICIIADDEDNNLHLIQADSLADGMGYITDLYNKQKIYLDSYYQEQTPSGQRYPDVNQRLEEQVKKGALVINYIGHGGTGGWAHERILQQADIQNWSNKEKLPVFITATCEFTRFDEPEIYSGGELVLLNSNGGGVALFTTTRLAYAQSNFRLNENLYSRMFVPTDGSMPYLGDLIRESKPLNQLTTRNFVLLGDPALKMAYPQYNVSTKTINGVEISMHLPDTIRSLQKVDVTGEITNDEGNVLQNFNGIIRPVIYDKTTIYKTIGNDPSSFPVEFKNQDKILWSGLTSVENGKFSFSFVLPKDMSFSYGQGKISYYANSESVDAGGEFCQLILGGIDENAAYDVNGPKIDLFLNDLSFRSGDQTHENPLMIGFIEDENGINLSSNGIGHTITAVLDKDYSNVLQLNEFYVADTNSYTRGTIHFPFYNLPDGKHTLELKAWDSYNNSSVAEISFVIDRNANLKLSGVKNFPNPFTDNTTFTFRHTKPGSELDIQLEIYNLQGLYIASYKTRVISELTETPFLVWDGKDVNGSKLNPGIYLYMVRVTDENGNITQQRQKLILQ
ncbi:MAG: type IX secretion system sortase PorU [Bacteroidales bacterium]|nr:type IX secretion system sortase PorU [Bacteroidales bacterium]MCF8404246.1 type IX secretion system sortase PorU [Bacteroidales bacterium]